jgi:hypothetical protein
MGLRLVLAGPEQHHLAAAGCGNEGQGRGLGWLWGSSFVRLTDRNESRFRRLALQRDQKRQRNIGDALRTHLGGPDLKTQTLRSLDQRAFVVRFIGIRREFAGQQLGGKAFAMQGAQAAERPQELNGLKVGGRAPIDTRSRSASTPKQHCNP